jgi:hypothetical protein
VRAAKINQRLIKVQFRVYDFAVQVVEVIDQLAFQRYVGPVQIALQGQLRLALENLPDRLQLLTHIRSPSVNDHHCPIIHFVVLIVILVVLLVLSCFLLPIRSPNCRILQLVRVMTMIRSS